MLPLNVTRLRPARRVTLASGGPMKLTVDTGNVSVTISDKDGYSPDKLDDWTTRAAVLLHLGETTTIHADDDAA
jgi:hypothetical protein